MPRSESKWHYSQIRRPGVKELSFLVLSVAERLPEPFEKKLVFSGGLLTHSASMVETLQECLREENRGIEIIDKPKGTALDGALLLARSLL